ncbi:MAG TPA: DNA primase [Acidimicrobiia bacterium]|nr:DNA primase [Acidimicrobiia bacterium]
MTQRGDIDRVREATDLVELISEVTKVKRSGRSFMAVCPFHEEKTPSMSVDQARGLYHCFGCGKGGDVFSFVQETQGIDFADSLEMLARRAGITLVRDAAGAKRRGRRGAAVDALLKAIEVYHERLKKAPEAGPARAYLRNRGYDLGVIDEWKIGFAGTDWDTLTKELRAGGVEDRVLIDAGLSRRGRHGLFDVFRGRLMFPIHDLRGDAVGFGGRKIEEVDRNSTNNPDAKYVNSADSIVYHKAQILFGLDRARREISDETPAVIVEGYTDVIAMHLAGIKTAVATCGTALGDGHFDLLRRFSEKVVLAFDSDEAGSRAALRGDELESPFRLDLDLRVAIMPDGQDPADLVQQERSEELVAAVRAARPLLETRIEHEVGRYDLGGPEGRARALHAGAQQVRRVNDEIARREYTRFLARLVGVELEAAEAAVEGERSRRRGVEADTTRPLDRIESELMRVLLADPAQVAGLTADDFSDERLRAAFVAIADDLGSTPAGQPVDLSRVAEDRARSLLRSLAMDDRPLPSGSEMLSRVKERRLDGEIAALRRELESMDQETAARSDKLARLIALEQEKRSTTRM